MSFYLLIVLVCCMDCDRYMYMLKLMQVFLIFPIILIWWVVVTSFQSWSCLVIVCTKLLGHRCIICNWSVDLRSCIRLMDWVDVTWVFSLQWVVWINVANAFPSFFLYNYTSGFCTKLKQKHLLVFACLMVVVVTQLLMSLSEVWWCYTVDLIIGTRSMYKQGSDLISMLVFCPITSSSGRGCDTVDIA